MLSAHLPVPQPASLLDTSQSAGKPDVSLPASDRPLPLNDDPITHVATVYPGAQLVQLKSKPLPSRVRHQRGGGRRRTISQFSKRTQRYMQEKLGKLLLAERPLFVDLTYPDNHERFPEHGFPTDPDVYGNDLQRFWDRLAYRYDVGMIWRLEYQAERGAPHYHLAVYGLPDRSVETWQDELTDRWLDVIETDHPAARQRAVSVRRPASDRDVVRGLAYLSKRNQGQLDSPHIEHDGRFWGMKGKKHLPFAEAVQFDLTEREAYRFRRPAETYRDKTSNRKIGSNPHNPGITLRRGRASEWKRWLDRIVGEREYVDVETGEVITYADAIAPPASQLDAAANGKQPGVHCDDAPDVTYADAEIDDEAARDEAVGDEHSDEVLDELNVKAENRDEAPGNADVKAENEVVDAEDGEDDRDEEVGYDIYFVVTGNEEVTLRSQLFSGPRDRVRRPHDGDVARSLAFDLANERISQRYRPAANLHVRRPVMRRTTSTAVMPRDPPIYSSGSGRTRTATSSHAAADRPVRAPPPWAIVHIMNYGGTASADQLIATVQAALQPT